uniref:Uncharacterized protein n=1 Tax=Avena sativa TaxID=4498 RepID=A0ACD5VP84_AVESA
MASGSETSARASELAALSGEKLVDLLRTTHSRTDFEAVARVLKARDRRFAEIKAALADIDALRRKHYARRRPRDEAGEMAPGISSKDPVHRDEPRVEELEDVPLSLRLKRLRRCETSALESGKRDGQGQSNSVGILGNYGQKSSSAKSVHSIGPKERIGQLVGSSTPKDSKQGRGAVEPEKWGGGRDRTTPLLSPGRSVLPKGSSESDHARARTAKKQGTSDGILGPPPKWNGKIIKTSMVESSSRSANKDTGTAMSLCRQKEDRMMANGGNLIHDGIIGPPPKWDGKIIKTSMVESSSRSANKDTGTAMSLCGQKEDRMMANGGNLIQGTRMVASHSLSIGSLSGKELRAYCLKPGRTPPASCMEISTQNFLNLTKRGNGLTKKPVDVSSNKRQVVGTEEHPKTTY